MIFGFLSPLVPFARSISPFIFLLSFISLVFLVFYNWRVLKSFFVVFDWKVWLLLFLVLVVDLVFLFSLPHYHKAWTDESMIILAAKNLMHFDSVGQYYKAIGWPFVLAMIFFFFGLNYAVAIGASCVFGALSSVLVFFIAYIMTGRRYLSLLSSVLFSLFVSQVKWSTTAESNVVSMFFVLFALFFCLLYYGERKLSLFWLACAALVFACLFRVEMAIFPILFCVGCLLFIPGFVKRLKGWKYVVCVVVCAIFIIISLISTHPYWGPSNEFTITTERGIWQCASIYLDYVFTESLLFSLTLPCLFFCVMAVFCLGGLVYCFVHSKKWAYFLVAWFVLANLLITSIALFNIFGGGMERFYTLFLPVLAILPIYVFIFIRSLLAKKNILSGIIIASLAVLLSALAFLNMNHSIQLSNLSNAEFYSSESNLPVWLSRDFPSDCVMITFLPEIVSSSSDFKVYSTSKFLSDPSFRGDLFNSTGCIVFVQEMLCNKNRPFGEVFYSECQRMHEEYGLELNQSYANFESTNSTVLFAAYLVREKVTP